MKIKSHTVLPRKFYTPLTPEGKKRKHPEDKGGRALKHRLALPHLQPWRCPGVSSELKNEHFVTQ